MEKHLQKQRSKLLQRKPRKTQQLLDSTILIPIKKNSEKKLGNEEEGEKNPPVDTNPMKKRRINTGEHPPPAKNLSPMIPPSPASPDCK